MVAISSDGQNNINELRTMIIHFLQKLEYFKRKKFEQRDWSQLDTEALIKIIAEITLSE
jgi:hypothetical protein